MGIPFWMRTLRRAERIADVAAVKKRFHSFWYARTVAFPFAGVVEHTDGARWCILAHNFQRFDEKINGQNHGQDVSDIADRFPKLYFHCVLEIAVFVPSSCVSCSVLCSLPPWISPFPWWRWWCLVEKSRDAVPGDAPIRLPMQTRRTATQQSWSTASLLRYSMVMIYRRYERVFRLL